MVNAEKSYYLSAELFLWTLRSAMTFSGGKKSDPFPTSLKVTVFTLALMRSPRNHFDYLFLIHLYYFTIFSKSLLFNSIVFFPLNFHVFSWLFHYPFILHRKYFSENLMQFVLKISPVLIRKFGFKKFVY